MGINRRADRAFDVQLDPNPMKRYRIISELGKGATGVVFRAVHADDGATVALKKLVLPGHLDARQEEEFINRFKSEAKAALSLKHPGIVSALDCGMDEGTFYIAYELIEGVTLEEAIKSGRKFSPEEVADIIAQSAEALEVAHDEGVVHRDLSPGNIFITNDGKARIADFGVAGFTSRATVTSDSDSIVGTPGFMAPEQITGGEADPRSDIFSLGCVAYELLAGQPAFSGQNIAQIIHRVINEQPRPIRELNPKVPLTLEELVFRMLAKNPDYRYQSMVEVHSAALRVLEEIPRTTKLEAAEEAGHAPMLAVTAGPYEGRRFNLQPTVTTIGRMIGDVLLADDKAVAGQHAWITREDTGWVLYDADTESGTFLNEERIEREEILPGDRIRIGETILEFRGAGGHVGAFKEAGEDVEAGKKKEAKKTLVPPRRVSSVLVMILAIPGLLVVAGLVMAGIVMPQRLLGALDDATNERWDTAFRSLDATAIGSAEWSLDASRVLADWRGLSSGESGGAGDGPLENAADFMAARWVIGGARINDEVLYRFGLFQLTEEFLVAVTAPQVADEEDEESGMRMTNPAFQKVRDIEPRISGLEVPKGVSPTWQGRRQQLLSVVRRWLAASSSGDAGTRASGFTAERASAQEALLTGWYTFVEAEGTDLGLLNSAFAQFQSCISTMTPLLESNPDDGEAAALRGLGYFLCARVKRQAGDTLGPDRYEQALDFLGDAEADMSRVNRESWDRAIPKDFESEFPSPASVNAQIRALRLTLNNLLSGSNPGG